MYPDWDCAKTPWRQSKPQSSDASSTLSSRAAPPTPPQLRQWATMPSIVNGSPQCRGTTAATTAATCLNTNRTMRGSRSAQGLASVGLGNFKIGALHDLMSTEAVPEDDGFCPGGFAVPQSFKGLNAEEHRPPPELFAWGQDRVKCSNENEPSTSPASTPTASVPVAEGRRLTGFPVITRSPTRGDRPYTVTGTKRKGPATAGGELSGKGGARGNASRRRASTEGAAPNGRKNDFSAVRGTDGAWQFVARAKSVRETPVSRGDALSLVREFEAAMAVIDDQGTDEGEGGYGAFTSPMQNDMHALQQEVGRLFQARECITEAVQIMEGRRDAGRYRMQDSDEGECQLARTQLHSDDRGKRHHHAELDASSLDLTAEWVRCSAGFGPENWAVAQRTLGGCLFEQKWLDLMCGELCEQVTVMCLPHGQLLQEMRRRNACTFHRMHKLYSDGLWALNRCVASVLGCRRERKQAEEDWIEKLAATCADYEAKIKAIHDNRGSEEQEQARAKKEARAQVDRMGDTLRTLNGIFKTMQADGKAITEVDLKDRCRSLEHELLSSKEEVNELRGLKEKIVVTEAEMQELKLELEQAKGEAATLSEEMNRRQSLVQELMESEAKRLTEIEALKAGSDRVDGGNGHDGEGEERENVRSNNGRDLTTEKTQRKYKRKPGRDLGATVGSTPGASPHLVSGNVSGSGTVPNDEDGEEEEEEEIGSSVLCIKCRKALDDLTNIADALEKERQLKGQPRLQCHGYRLLLPNLKGFKPPRTVAWVRTAMRAILRAKIWDDSVLRYKQDLRVRFPEFVYSWFEPPREAMAVANASGKSKLVAQADDDRWGLYYGVKALAQESAEATIFWHALNESNGEDYLTFLIYCLATVEGTVGSALRKQWGVSDTCTNLYTLERKIEEGKHVKARRLSEDSHDPHRSGITITGMSVTREITEGEEQTERMASGRDVVWLLHADAVETVDHILVKALDDQKRKVLEATKAISVSCDGRLPKQNPTSTCVDLFLFLRIMLHSFKEEQVNRRAAVRLMFETAATGVLTDGTPIYGDGRVDQSALAAAETVYNSLLNESKATVDLPQFMAIARTLWPEVTTSDAVAVFRDAHEETSGEVDYQAFLKLADRWQFFSNALQLPVHMPSRADLGERLNTTTRRNLGALVHRHYALMKPAFEVVKESLPESAVKQLVKCQRAVERELHNASPASCRESSHQSTRTSDGSTGSGGSDESISSKAASLVAPMSMDGTRPLAAYRRLLAIFYHVRNVRHESGPGYESAGGQEATVVQKTEAEFRALETVFFDLHVDPRFQTYDKIRQRLAATRVQRTWRKMLARSCEVPLGMLGLMRPGYLRGRGGVSSRAVHHPPFWVQQQVAEAYTAKLRSDSQVKRYGLPTHGPTSGASHRPLFWVTFQHLLRQWGSPELAERAAHDLFFNVRSLAPALSRLRLFGAFLGCLPREESELAFDGDTELRDEDALAFYLRAVMIFHIVGDEETARAKEEANDVGGGREVDETALREKEGVTDDTDEELRRYLAGGGDHEMATMIDDGPKVIQELFPVSLQDPRTGRQYWHAPAVVANDVIQTLFEKCSQAPPVETGPGGRGQGRDVAQTRARVSEVQMSLGKLMGHPAVTGGREGRVDVDDVLWLIMKHWLVVQRHRRGLVDRALGLVAAFPSHVSATPTVPVSTSPLASADTFRSASTRFEKLSRSAPSSAVRDLVYDDAYLVALCLSRQREGKTMSPCEAAKKAMISSPLLLWDVSGERQEHAPPPSFSARATRSWLLSAWTRYSSPLQAELPVLLQEVRGSLEEPDGASEIKANDPPAEVTSADRDDGREVSKVARRPYVGYQPPQLNDAERAQLVRAIEKAQAEVARLNAYMDGLEIFHKGGSGKGVGDLGKPAVGTGIVSLVEEERHQPRQEQTLPPEATLKYALPGDVERASKEMKSLVTVLSAVYRKIRPGDPRDFIQDNWVCGRRASIRRTSFNSY